MKKLKEEGQLKGPSRILEEEPELYSDLVWVWHAFSDLSHSRNVSMGGPLPLNYTDIANYFNLTGITGTEEKRELLHYLKMLDRLWVNDYYQKNGTQTKAPDGKINKKK